MGDDVAVAVGDGMGGVGKGSLSRGRGGRTLSDVLGLVGLGVRLGPAGKGHQGAGGANETRQSAEL